ncbi:hypothetical protein [Natrinema gelatinilyticum]|uniref:hypothetical protein n=1 Tax=Natrinema gelatinilyticum TaxID=2961571 RepID=UPI0020C52CCB|nr:hypothetical protein [Natrinema gelatinilyticum]
MSGSDDTDDTSGGNGLSADGSDVFASIEMNGTHLEVEVADGTSVESINLIDPNRELADQQRLANGETKTSFEILGRFTDDLSTGEYELVALDEDETIEKTTITLEADCTITDVLWAAENPDMEWDKNSPVWDEYAAVVIENEGTIPSMLTELRWKGAPAAKLGTDDTISYYHETRLPAGKTTVYSVSQIYQTGGATGSLDCSELGTEPMTVMAVVQIGDNPTYTQQIKYSGGQSCNLSIVNGSSGASQSNGGGN